MLDAGRRFFPMDNVKDIMQVMVANKLNVLHLHASDYCRFGVESKLFPNLTAALTGDGRNVTLLGPTHLQSPLAIVASLRHWAHWLRGPFIHLHTDHESLKYLDTCSRPLTSRQARWVEYLADTFHMKIYYIPGKENVCADALSRRTHRQTMSDENASQTASVSESFFSLAS